MAVVVNSLGRMIGWSSVTLRLLGRDVVGISKIEYGPTTNVEKHFGAGTKVVGKSHGNEDAVASIDLYEEEVTALQKALPAGQGLQDIADFDIPVVYELPNNAGTRKDIIHNCSFSTWTKTVNQGDGKIVMSFPLSPTHISFGV